MLLLISGVIVVGEWHLLNITQRQLSKRAFLYLLFPILFTIGFILGSLFGTTLRNETYIAPEVKIENIPFVQNFINLIVIIFSSPENHERRQVIRDTWLLTKGNNSVKHYFALGVSSLNRKKLIFLKNEHKVYEDLLFLYSFSDSYSRLSEKLRETFKYIDIKNVQYKYLLKVDDDTFVRLDALSNALMELPQEKLYWGFFDGEANVKTKGKWKEEKWFLCDKYLPYAKGGGYLLSQDLVQLIVSVADYLTPYRNEDVSLGTWLAPFEINRVHEPNFDTEYLSRGCFNSYLITHKQSLSMMKQKYKNIISTGKLCQAEHRMRNSYVYNWNVPPSQCCSRNEDVP